MHWEMGVPLDAHTPLLGFINDSCNEIGATPISYEDYVSSKLPANAHCYLEKQLDWDNDYQRDIIKIARDMLHWEEKLVGHMELTPRDIHDTRLKFPESPELQRSVYKQSYNTSCLNPPPTG